MTTQPQPDHRVDDDDHQTNDDGEIVCCQLCGAVGSMARRVVHLPDCSMTEREWDWCG